MAKEINASEIKGSNSCHRKKEKLKVHAAGDKNEMYRKVVITKEAISKYLSKPQVLKNFDEVDEFITKEMDSLPYKNTQQKIVDTLEIQGMVKRYLRSEKRRSESTIHGKVKVLGQEIAVNPNLVFKGEKKDKNGNVYPYTEVVILKKTKPVLKKTGRSQETNIEKNIEINCALQLAKQYMGDTTGLISGSIYYLKKEKESESDYSDDFEIAKQVATIEDVYIAGDTEMSMREIALESEFKKYLEGGPCTKGMCKRCEYNSICNYVKAPVQTEEEKKPINIEGLVLSPQQIEAINFSKGFARINAGAGTGKTLVVSMRVIKLLRSGVKPENIILTTFTNAGVDEMKTRIKFLVDEYGMDVDLEKLTIVTLNGFGNMLLSKYYKKLGYTRMPLIADIVDKYDIIFELLDGLSELEGLDYQNILMNEKNHKGAVPYIAKHFDFIKEMCDSADDYIAKAAITDDMKETATKIYNLEKEFEKRMKEKNLVDFNDQDNVVFEILKFEPFLFEKYFRYSHIIVDEFQDCSESQINLIKEMCSTSQFQSLMVVGDDSQAIYGFRNTSPKYMINLEKYLEEKVYDIFITENHRSTPEIISVANYVNSLNKNRIDKNLIAVNESGKKPLLTEVPNQKVEYKYISDEIANKIKAGYKPSDICVIARTKAEIGKIQNELAKLEVPTHMLVPELAITNSNVEAAIELAMFVNSPEATRYLLVYLNALFDGMLMDEVEVEKVQRMLDKNAEDFRTIFFHLMRKIRWIIISNC